MTTPPHPPGDGLPLSARAAARETAPSSEPHPASAQNPASSAEPSISPNGAPNDSSAPDGPATDRLTHGLEVAVRVVLAALILLKTSTLVSETAMWSRADPILAPLPMAIPVILALVLETLVFFVLGERSITPSSKALCLTCFITLVAGYRVAGLILNGPNLAGCNCFGTLGRWLSGTASTALAAVVLAFLAFAAWRYRRAHLKTAAPPEPTLQPAQPVSTT